MNIPQRVIDELSGFTQEAAKAYHAVYDGKDERKTRFIDQICNFFTAAKDTYALGPQKWKSDTHKIMTLAQHAEHTLRLAEIAFEDWYGLKRRYWKFTNDDNAKEIDILQKCSDKLASMGWLHLPILEKWTKEGHERDIKTAAGVVKDMNDIVAARDRLLNATSDQSKKEKDQDDNMKQSNGKPQTHQTSQYLFS